MEKGITDYRIVISQNPTAEEKSAAAQLRNVIEKATGVRLTVDENRDASTSHELLVGYTGREESNEAYNDPVLSVRDTFGDSDVYRLTEKYSLEELRAMLK